MTAIRSKKKKTVNKKRDRVVVVVVYPSILLRASLLVSAFVGLANAAVEHGSFPSGSSSTEFEATIDAISNGNNNNNETLLDLLDRIDVESGEDSEEVYPPLRGVSHYVVSWSLLMSSISTGGGGGGNYSSSDSTFFASNSGENNNWKPQAQLSCPDASRLVLGLVDDTGKRVSPISSAEDILDDAYDCEPPINEMSKNVLECIGSFPQKITRNKYTKEGHQQPKILLEQILELTCLEYAEDGEDSSVTGNNNNNKNPLQLVIVTPAQTIKVASTRSMALTETFHVAKITDLSRYIELTGNDSSSSNMHKKKESILDSSMFSCTTGSPSSYSDSCDDDDDDDHDDEPTNLKGICYRSAFCYDSTYSDSDSLGGTCKASMDALTMISPNLPLDNNGRSRRRTTSSISTLSELMAEKDKQLRRHAVPPPFRGLQPSNYSESDNNNFYHHESRYRLLWTATNLGCKEYTSRVQLSCSNADTIIYAGSTTSTTSTNTNTYRNNNNNPYPTFQQQSSSIECFQSLMEDNTLYCQRTIPSAIAVDHDSEQYLFYQELQELDIFCGLTKQTKSHNNQNSIYEDSTVTVHIPEISNIQCLFPRNKGQHWMMPMQTGSAITVVPVSLHDETTTTSTHTATTVYQNHVVEFPPNQESVDVVANMVQCHSPLSCERNNMLSPTFTIHYRNHIGNKVAQEIRGCQSFGSCSSNDGDGNACFIDSIPSLTLTYQDSEFNAISSQRSGGTAARRRIHHVLISLWLLLLAEGAAFWGAFSLY